MKNEYVEAIKQREKEYPTGLPSTDPVVAIPHANYEMVKKTTLAIATLNEPVLFENMENYILEFRIIKNGKEFESFEF